MLRLTSLALNIIQAILQSDEPKGISLSRLHKNLPVCWQRQQVKWRVKR